MSGFVAVVDRDGAPTDPALIGRLVDQLRFRGPDHQEIWTGPSVGLGHALFRTTDEEGLERQPCSLDGQVWITGDVRVDGRADLVRALTQSGHAPAATANDPQLVLTAYAAWGERLVERLIGDFSFAIWDSRERRLFCARDQLGVRPFFYAQAGNQLIVSNTLSCIQSHPLVGDALNDDAIADFFLFGFNGDAATTTFAAIDRLPAGHSLQWSPAKGIRIQRYWTLPQHDQLRLPRPADYVEQFNALLASATADRLRTDRVGIHMSGGLDSTLIAALAKRLLATNGTPCELRAHTIVYDRLFSDPERHFSSLAAQHLDIPIDYLVADDHGLFGGMDEEEWCFPEPTDSLSLPSQLHAFHRQVSARGGVALTGLDGDAVLTASWRRQLEQTAGKFDLATLALQSVQFLHAKKGWGRAFSTRMRPRAPTPAAPPFPVWLARDFVRQTQLVDRWAAAKAHRSGGGPRRGAHDAMTARNWLPTFEGFDAGTHGTLVERRHPLVDLRVVAFCLSLPAIPWCIDKHVMREAGRGLLPRAVLNRPKVALGGDPLPFAIRRYWEEHQTIDVHPDLARFINIARTDALIDETKSSGYWFGLRGLILNQWLNVSRN